MIVPTVRRSSSDGEFWLASTPEAAAGALISA
jgi:hypothetical protein